MIEEFKGEYRWLSNFAPVDIKWENDIVYPSVEHFFVSWKTNHVPTKRKIAGMEHPAQAKKYGQKLDLPDNWEQMKDMVMMIGLIEKFQQEPYKTKLLETNDEVIQEGNWWGDTYWGIDLKTGEGQNKLGKMIMEVRDELNAMEEGTSIYFEKEENQTDL